MHQELLTTIRSARPSLPLFARAVMEAVLLVEGPIGSADAVAKHLGLRNRFTLARLLQHHGLPPLHRLAEWASVLSWVKSTEQKGVSLCWLAHRSRRHPSACYRLVKDVTGLTWSVLRARGSAWVEARFVKTLYGTRPTSTR